MRLFVALDIDPEIRRAIAKFMNQVWGSAPDVRWVLPPSLHVTLKFVGEWPPERLEELKRALAHVRGNGIEISFSGTGFFPTAKSARVFWIGIHSGPELRSLAGKIDRATSALGIESEHRPFTPHLTLARTGSGRPQRTLRDRVNSSFRLLAESLAKMSPPEFGKMTVREFFLYESKLSPKGAVYTKLAEFPLALGEDSDT
jgi:2'-5' RNA ligase